MARLEMKHVINASCPWSGEPVRADSLAAYRGQVVGFCNPGCRDKFERAMAHFDTALAVMAEKSRQAS
jgi:hypothetical protein